MEKYIVGGYVRDRILGIPSNDIDYVVINETIESMKRQGFTLVGLDFPVFLHPETKDEYALARLERKVGKGYSGFECDTENVSLKTDLGRRDLTINAIAMTEEGDYIDPYNGKKDIEDKILRHTTEAFSEDPVRVLRLARFTARFVDFTIAEETKILARSLKDELVELTPERVFLELEKALKSEKPSNYFRNLLELDALENVHPEIFAMIGVEQRTDYHAEGDVFEHTMRVLDEVSKISKDPVVRYAALYHDIGKPIVDKGTGSFFNHEGEKIVKPAFKVLKDKKHPKRFALIGEKVAIYHTFIHKFKEMKATTLVKKMKDKKFVSSMEELNILLDVSLADERGRILGTRKLSFDEAELMYNGGTIEGFEFRDNTEHYSVIRKVLEVLLEKVVLPSDIIAGEVKDLLEFQYLERVRRVKKVLRESKR